MKIKTRDDLLSTLAEASELEHNLMCLYLYAAFSLKQSTTEGVSQAELETITTWRKEILGVACQEMTHLALVTNLTTAVGGSAHLFRPGFPAKAGYFPSDFVIELAPFSLATLDHFIFLERPEDREVPEGQDFQPEHAYTRAAPEGRLMAYTGDYETGGTAVSHDRRGHQGSISHNGRAEPVLRLPCPSDCATRTRARWLDPDPRSSLCTDGNQYHCVAGRRGENPGELPF